jgi:hypothetical protein
MDSYIHSESRYNGAASPEEWIDELSHFSRSLQDADSLENDVVTSAVSAVERTAPDMLLWVQSTKDDATRLRLEYRVQHALESICSLRRIVREDSEKLPQMMIRVLNVADHLLECHKCILDQQIDRAATSFSE